MRWENVLVSRCSSPTANVGGEEEREEVATYGGLAKVLLALLVRHFVGLGLD